MAYNKDKLKTIFLKAWDNCSDAPSLHTRICKESVKSMFNAINTIHDEKITTDEISRVLHSGIIFCNTYSKKSQTEQGRAMRSLYKKSCLLGINLTINELTKNHIILDDF